MVSTNSPCDLNLYLFSFIYSSGISHDSSLSFNSLLFMFIHSLSIELVLTTFGSISRNRFAIGGTHTNNGFDKSIELNKKSTSYFDGSKILDPGISGHLLL